MKIDEMCTNSSAGSLEPASQRSLNAVVMDEHAVDWHHTRLADHPNQLDTQRLISRSRPNGIVEDRSACGVLEDFDRDTARAGKGVVPNPRT